VSGDASLAELRRELGVTQVRLAERMGASQRSVSHLEHESNPRVETLRRYVGALGGRLEIRAVFEDSSRAVAVPPKNDRN
jgi:transcriptional regulator with XRE-family HTH domain